MVGGTVAETGDTVGLVVSARVGAIVEGAIVTGAVVGTGNNFSSSQSYLLLPPLFLLFFFDLSLFKLLLLEVLFLLFFFDLELLYDLDFLLLSFSLPPDEEDDPFKR